ncbi:MAG: MFS transporter [Pirellulales bacterium]|nr:MFS transporter [Pirellulales bacterium]
MKPFSNSSSPLKDRLPSLSPADHLGPGSRRWLVLLAAMLGWMFDGVEMGLFPIAARPALQDLLNITNDARVGPWIAVLTALFLLGAATGGLLFGWLGDRLGRVSSMAISIFTYSLFTGACYFAQEPWHLGVCRFFAALGMGGEWSLGVALVVECWPDRLRPLLAGVIGAAGNLGLLLIAVMAMSFRVTAESWRWTMLACASPAALALFVILFLPESARWKESVKKKAAQPLRELFSPRLIRPVLLGILFSSIPLIGTWGAVTAFMPSWVDQLVGPENPHAKGTVLCIVSLGAIVGCFLGPLVGAKFGRRPAYFGLCLFSFIVVEALFFGMKSYNGLFLVMAGLAGCATASFYGWLPLYLPELFPTRVRATAQGVCYNSGRIFAAVGSLTTGQLLAIFHGSYAQACAAVCFVYLIGMAAIWLAPETKGKPLPE